MKQRISILGCGWLGLALGRELVENGYKVNGSTTSKDTFNKLKSRGIYPFEININKKSIDFENFLSSKILIIAIPSKNVDSFKKLISKIENSSITKVLFVSSTSVYPNTNSVVTENSPIKKSPLSEIECLFTSNSKFKTTVLRFGGLFGYNRKPGNFIKKDNKIKNPNGYVNLIHRDDCIEIITQIITKRIWKITLNACASSHPKRSVFYTKQMARIGKYNPLFDANSQNEFKIVSVEKLILLLNFKFKYYDLMTYDE